MGRPTRRPWDPVEIAFLKQSAGKSSWQEIAHTLGRSVKSVSDRARKLGLHRTLTRRYTTEEIADLFGVTTYRVQQWKHRGWLRATSAGISRRAVLQLLGTHLFELDLSRARADRVIAFLLGKDEALP